MIRQIQNNCLKTETQMPRKKKERSIYITKEPDWKTLREITDPEKQIQAFNSCEYFVRTEISRKKMVNAAKHWVKEKSGWTKEEIKIILNNPDWAFASSGIALFVEYKLGYMPESTKGHYEKRKEEWLKRGKEFIKEKQKKAEEKPKKVISIQERMKQQVEALCAEWEYKLDSLTDEKLTLKEFKPYEDMLVYQPEVKANHAKIIKEEFENEYNEALEVQEWKDDQIKEAYSHMSAKMRKDFVAFFEKINTACDTIIETKKSTRKSRKPRARSKETIVKKLKYQINDSELGVASIHPTDIVNCNELWVYNTKTRKIGVYHALSKDPRGLSRPSAGLMIKGTTIQDFCTKSSLQKTLRKPKEQITNWTGKAKTKFAKSFDELKTTPIKMNGRINDNTIILKAF